MKKLLFSALVLLAATTLSAQRLMNQAPDYSRDFVDMSSIYFFAERLTEFDAAKGEGKVQWGRYSLEPRQAFNTNTVVMDRLQMKDFPESGYENDPRFSFKVDFISDRTVRVRMLTSLVEPREVEEVMFSPEFIANDPHVAWACSETENEIVYTSPEGSSLTIVKQPWRLVAAEGRVHFYEKKDKGYTGEDTGDLQKIDVGIALCHFLLGLEAQGKTPSVTAADPGIPTPADTEYIATVVI